MVHSKRASKLLPITSPNINGLQKFFNRHTLWKIRNNVIIITPHVAYTVYGLLAINAAIPRTDNTRTTTITGYS